jgi:hypothetical protein
MLLTSDGWRCLSVLPDTIPPKGLKTMTKASLLEQLKTERDRVLKQLSGVNAALTAFAGVHSGNNGKRQISAAGKKRIAAAQRARWAKIKDNAKVATPKRMIPVSTRKKAQQHNVRDGRK